MKANELMIGDWVCTEHDAIPRQIDWIRTGEVGLLWNKVVTPPYLVPIPITPEILEKNGFEEFDGWRILDMDDVEIRWIGTTLEISGSHGNMDLPDVQCVHELQHALRLCGIDKKIVV